MKDEEMAEEYLKDESKYLIEDNEGNLINITKKVEEAFLAGLKAGRPQWHDLRKDLNDLPPQSCLYWDVSERVLGSYKIAQNQYITNISRYSYVDKCWILADGDLHENIIAWCEIPTFDKE